MKTSLFPGILIWGLWGQAEPLKWWQRIGPLPSSCKIVFAWAHREGVKNVFYYYSRSDTCVVGQGCAIDGINKVKGVTAQYGSNGLWMFSLDPQSNGGMNPRISKEAARLDRAPSPKYFKDFSKAETNALKAQSDEVIRKLKQSGTDKEKLEEQAKDQLHRDINSVGFMRMTAYNWFATLAEAKRKIGENGGCQRVEVSFICPDEKYTGLVGPLGDFHWKERIDFAEKTNVFSYYENRPITFRKKVCALDASSHPRAIENIPMTCGSKYKLDKATVDALMQGQCGPQIRLYEREDVSELLRSLDPVKESVH